MKPPESQLATWRTERGLSRAALAALLGLDRLTIYRWEQPPESKQHREPPPFLWLALKQLEGKR